MNLLYMTFDLVARLIHLQYLIAQSSYKKFYPSIIPGGEDIYILGTSPSILKLTKSSFATLSQGFSIGINGFCFHEFIPNIYAVEFSDSLRWNSSLSSRLSLQLAASDHSSVLLRAYSGMKYLTLPSSRVYTYNILRPHFLSSRSPLQNAIPAINRLSNISTNLNLPILLGFLSTLDRLLFLSLLSKPKSITLVGIDLNTSEHFYEISMGVLPAESTVNTSKYHPTFTNDFKGVSLLQIVSLYSLLFESLNIPFSVESSSSAIASILPVNSLR